MTSRRWKLATLVFATATAVLALREPPAPSTPTRPAYKGPATPAITLRKSTGPARKLGVDEATLIAELRGERDARRVLLLINKLAVIGSDAAVEALVDFADDRRPHVASNALYAIGQIGTESGVEFLLAFEGSGPPKLRGDTIGALGTTLHDEARVRLLEIAQDPSDPERTSALYALGPFEHDDVVKALGTIASTAEYWTARIAISELGDMTIPSARTTLLTFLRSPDSRVVAYAIDAIPDLPSTELYALLESGDATIAAAAASALGRSGDTDALAALEHSARNGAESARTAAIAAIAELGGGDAHALLARLLVTGDTAVARAAADALAASGEDDARAILLATARKPGLARTAVLRSIKGLRGADIEELMLDVGRTGTTDERELAFQNLIETGSARGFALAVAAAKQGTEGTYVIGMIAQGPSREARRALEELARSSHPPTRMTALENLAELGIDASTQTLLGDMLASGDSETRRQAASVLAKSGTRAARATLMTAVGSSDKTTAEAAIRVLLDADGSPAARDAIVRAARTTPALREQAIDALLEHGAPEGLTLARDALTGDDADLATDAANALGRAEDSTATDVLLASASSSQPNARIAAAKGLADRGDPRSRDALTRLARDTSPEVRAEAYEGLADLGTPDAITALTDIATSGSDGDRREAIEALGSVRGSNGHDALYAAMTDPNASPAAQTAAARQLEYASALAEEDRHFLDAESNAEATEQ